MITFRCGARQEPNGCQRTDTLRLACGTYRCPEHVATHLAACEQARGER